MDIAELPKFSDFLKPTLAALDRIGGSASLNEIDDAVIEMTGLTADALNVEYESGAGPVIPDRLSWARSHLKAAGFLSSGGRGVWLLTDDGRAAMKIPADELKRQVASAVRASVDAKRKTKSVQSEPDDHSGEGRELDWRDELIMVLRAMDPAGFERLCQRLLRESGFVKVEVTGRSGDGGIDGTGILQLSLMSFHVLFQCKRYQG